MDLDVVGEDVVSEDTGPLRPGEVQAVEGVAAREGWWQALQLLVTHTQLRQSALMTAQSTVIRLQSDSLHYLPLLAAAGNGKCPC